VRLSVACPDLYRARQAPNSPLYRLLESCYEEVKGQWDEGFARRYGLWRGACEDAVYAFLDCGIYEHGFARVRCDACRAEYLVAFSCQRPDVRQTGHLLDRTPV